MTAATPLPGMPEPPARDADYETWAAGARPAYVAAAATGRSFVCWKVARDAGLPDPPNPSRDWARLMGSLHHDGVVRYDGFGLARDKSAVRRWRGTAASRRDHAGAAA